MATATKQQTAEPTCYGLSRSDSWQQEWYETASRDAVKRAKQLRESGYTTVVQAMGPQVTNVGSVKLTLLTILNADNHVPPVKIEAI